MNSLPFWEVARGGGPLTRWEASRRELASKAKERRERIEDPLAALGDSTVYQTLRDGLTRAERREAGLCIQCGGRVVEGRSRCRDHLERAAALHWQKRRRKKARNG